MLYGIAEVQSRGIRCNSGRSLNNRDKPQSAISLGEYINSVVSRIVIDPLDLKQFLPKFKYF